MSFNIENHPEVKATKKEWIGLLVLALPCMLYSMDLTVLNLAVPQLSLALRPTASQLLWIVDIYGFFIAGSLITMGTLGDLIGRRKLLLIGGAFFAMASAMAAFSNSAEMLIATRALQGIAGATLAPSTLSLIRVLFKNPKERIVAVGLWGTSFSVGGLIGPVIGGIFIQNFWWGSVFLINIPVMFLLLLIGPYLLPEYKNPQAGRMDASSVGLSLVAILLMIFGLKKTAELGFLLVPNLCILVGSFLIFVFVKRQAKLQYPLIDLNLFKNFTFNALIITNCFTMFAIFGTFLFTSQYMQSVMGLSPLRAGFWSMAFSVGFIFSSLFSPLAARKIRPAYVMACGLILGSFGFLLVSLVNGPSDLAFLVAGTLIFSFGSSPVLLFTTNMLINSAPAEKAGSAAAISETGNELGGALGIAILGSLGTFIYRRNFAKVLNAELPIELKTNLLSTLENALHSARNSSAELSPQLITQAESAFTAAFQSVMLVAALILFSLSVLVLTKLRHVRLESEHGE